MDIMGPLPPARGGAKFIIVAVDYFTKWIEAKPLVRITGKEAVIPAEIGILTYRTLMIREGYNEEVMRLNLDLLHERREMTAIPEARRNKASMVEGQGKLGPKWEGPYKVMEAYENGFYKLQTLEDKEAKVKETSLVKALKDVTYPIGQKPNEQAHA
nr:hypothetical protein [Tanacetum cinerariifolium]